MAVKIVKLFLGFLSFKYTLREIKDFVLTVVMARKKALQYAKPSFMSLIILDY